MKTLILVSALVFSTTIFAGPGGGAHSHGHGHSQAAPAISKEKTQEIGKFHISRLVKAEKLESTWSEAVYDQSEKKVFSGSEEWVVTFTNEKSTKEKKLFIFLKISGEFVAANFTGK